MGKTWARFCSSLFILGAAVGAGTFGLAVLSAPASAATVITVNDASDPTSTLPASNCTPNAETDCTLRAALAEATVLNEAVTIDLPDPTTVMYNADADYSVDGSITELDVTDTGGTVTIVGAGASIVDIRAINDTRVLEVGNGMLGGVRADISGVTISGGNAPSGEGSDCGGICVSSGGSTLTLSNSTVSGNTAGTSGGGIGLYRGGSATLIGDTITGNTAATNGGGIYVVSNDSTTASNLTIRNTTISDNQVDAGNGGGIDAFNSSGTGVDGNVTIDIDRSTINGNEIDSAGGAGAGIAASDGNWTVTNSTLSGNNAGATSVDGGGAFIANTAGSTSLTSTWQFDTVAGNSAGNTGLGGDVDVQGGTLNFGESILAGGLAGSSPDNCSVSGGTLHSDGYNLIDDTSCGTPGTGDVIGQSPQLGPLANNGGPTTTQLPADGSPAVGAVPQGVTSGTGVNVDQRGDARGQGENGSSTVGSVEIAQATPPTTTTTTTPSPAPAPTRGYWLVGSDGGIFNFGSAQFYGSTGDLNLQRPIVGISPTANKEGYWLVASDGGIFAFGNAGYHGSVPGMGLAPAASGLPDSLNAPIVGMVPSSHGGGYFMVASDGGVFAFGDAHFAGSCPGVGGCAGAVVAVLPDASGNGYWLITTTGNVYAFGDAPYDGAPGVQAAPVTSAVRTPDGGGYYILLANGAVYAYGDAVAQGGPVGLLGPLNMASAIFSDADGGGYWVAAADGAVFSYGNAAYEGSMAGSHINGSIIAATGF